MAISAASSPAHTPIPRQTAFPPPPPPQLTIPLSSDDDTPPATPTPAPLKLKPTAPKKAATQGPTRRELLQRGKEGSRRRQRWENDHFVSNPHFVPPTTSDWEPRPLYPRRNVPYQYASLWEHPSFPRRPEQPPIPAERVPKELKNRLKKSHGALALLEALEREVREFLLAEEEGEVVGGGYESSVAAESEDGEEDEIVFVSRRERGEKKVEETKVLFQSRVEEDGASFGRWLVHSIAGYYGLQSWSVTAGNPAVRYAYVSKTPRAVAEGKVPKPLYLMM